MSRHEIELYAAAAVVVGAGVQVLSALVPVGWRAGGGVGRGAGEKAAGGAGGTRVPGAREAERAREARGAGGQRGSPFAVYEGIWAAWARRPLATGVVLAFTVVMAVLQYVIKGLPGDLMREPGALSDGQWWRLFTALFVQSSGAVQIAVNVAALAVAGAIAEWVFGSLRWLLVYFAAGLVANLVSLEGWGRHGGGNSVAICGLLGALAALVALRGVSPGPGPGPGLGYGPGAGARGSGRSRGVGRGPLRVFALLIPAAGVFLCAIHNNHGAGIVTGCVLGLAIGVTARPGTLRLGPYDGAAGDGAAVPTPASGP